MSQDDNLNGPPPSPGAGQPSNQGQSSGGQNPGGQNPGGKNRRRFFFKKKRHQGAQGGQGGQGQQNGQSRQNFQGRHKQNNRRNRRPGPGFVGPMDHSYRNGEANGNVDPQARFQKGGRGAYNQPRYPQPDMTPIATRENVPARIFCFIEDLFFLAKINEISKKLGVKVQFVKEIEPILERAGDEVPEDQRPALVVFDLNNANIKPLTLISKLRAKLKKSTSIIGFVQHVQGDLKIKAQEAGCDMVMPRSAFSSNLANLLRRHAESDEDLIESEIHPQANQ